MLSTALLQGKNRLPNTTASGWLCRATCWKLMQLFSKPWQSLKWLWKTCLETEVAKSETRALCGLKKCYWIWLSTTSLKSTISRNKDFKEFFWSRYMLSTMAATSPMWLLSTWNVARATEMSSSVKYILDFKDCTKNQKRTWNRSLIILYWFHIEVIFWI